MAELLDQAAAKPTRSRRRGWSSVAGPVLGMSALAIGGVGVVLGLDPGAAGQELSLPALHDIPGPTDVPGGRGQEHADPARPVGAPGLDATTGIAPLTDGAPPPAALPGSVTAPRPGAGQPTGRLGSASHGPAAPVTVTPTPSRTRAPAATARPTTTPHPSTSPRSGRPGGRPPSTPRPTTTPTRATGPSGGGLPRSDSRVSAPTVPFPGPGSSSSSTSSVSATGAARHGR